MSYNPYAAPQVEVLPPPPPTGNLGEPRPWTVGEVLSIAWARIKVDGGAIVVASVIGQAIAGLPGQLPAILSVTGVVRQNDSAYWPIFSVCAFAGFVIGMWMRGGILKTWLDAARGRRVEVGDVFKGGKFFLPLLASELLAYLATSVGLMLLVVPGIYVALGFSQSAMFVVDRGMGPIEALRASWRAMHGQRGGVFGFYVASFFVALAGLLVCCMGVLVAAPMIGVASVVVYLRITGQDDASRAVGGP